MDISNFSQGIWIQQQQALDIFQKTAWTASMFKREAQSTFQFIFLEMFEHSLNQFIIQNSPRSQLFSRSYENDDLGFALQTKNDTLLSQARGTVKGNSNGTKPKVKLVKYHVTHILLKWIHCWPAKAESIQDKGLWETPNRNVEEIE